MSPTLICAGVPAGPVDDVVVHRLGDQRRRRDVAGVRVLLRAGQLELQRAVGRIGDDRHRRRGQRGVERRVGEVGDPLEDREVGHRRQQEAGQHDRLAADLVGEPAEQDEERRAEHQRDGDHDLPLTAGDLQRLRQEEQRVELPAVPDHRFAGGGAEQRQDGDLGVRPGAEGLGERRLGAPALVLHLLEHRRFVQAQPDPDRDRRAAPPRAGTECASPSR